MKIEQEVGGTKPTQDAYVGAERQVTVDMDNWDIRLHDGETPGGHPILSRDNNDERYQAKSEELDGINFTPEKRGFLARLGTGVYRIRKLLVNAEQLTVANPDGYGGDPKLGLADRIETDHTFGGDILIEGVLEVESGINGDTAGKHTGPVVGDVTGNLTGDVTGDASGNHTGSFAGDLDVRGKAIKFDEGQIPLEAIGGVLDFVLDNAMRVGFIIMWSGSELDIPERWALCNGLNGTPDLRDKFVIGAGGLAYEPGDTGGATTHDHGGETELGGAHTPSVEVGGHALTVDELPSHKHLNGVVDKNDNLFNHGGQPAVPTKGDSIDGNSSAGTREGYTTGVGGDQPHEHPVSVDEVAAHRHPITDVNHLPPYYALCFIMRIPTL
jgi:hypothetical protein